MHKATDMPRDSNVLALAKHWIYSKFTRYQKSCSLEIHRQTQPAKKGSSLKGNGLSIFSDHQVAKIHGSEMRAESLLVDEGHSHSLHHLAAVPLVLFDVQFPVARGAVTQPHSLCCCQV